MAFSTKAVRSLTLFFVCTFGLLSGCSTTGESEQASEIIQPAFVGSIEASPPSKTTPTSPCELMSVEDRSTAGITSVGRDISIGTQQSCTWTATDRFVMVITVNEELGVDDLRLAPGRPITVGSRQALQLVNDQKNDGSCAVAFDRGETGSAQVDVRNTSFRDNERACQKATTVAKLIEPKLP